jgi:hypothetical protein
VPFTGSHPAAVLPLLRTGLPASALVIGSVAPDLPYFVPVTVGGFHPPTGVGGPSHTAWALVTLDPAIGLLAFAVWHGLLAAPLLDLAPAGLRARLAGRVRLGLRHRLAAPRRAAAVVVALVVGATTHVLWDEFTHAGRFGTDHVPALSATWAGLEGYRWAQYASGVVGAVALAVWFARWWRRTPADADVPRRPEPLVWGAVVAAGVLAGVVAALRADGLRAAAFAAITTGGAAAIAAVFAVAVVWHRRAERGRATR